MKEQYAIRKMDKLGRICIPHEYRDQIGIGIDDFVDIFFRQNEIVLKKHTTLSKKEEFIKQLLQLKREEQNESFPITKNEIEDFNKILDQYVNHISNKKK